MMTPSAPSKRRRLQSPTSISISRRNQGYPTSPAATSPAARLPRRLPSPGLFLRSGGLPTLSLWLGLPPGLGFAVNRAGRSLQEVERAQVAPKQAPLELRTLCSTVPSHLYGPGPPLSPGPFRSRPIVEAPLARSTSPAPLMLRTRRVNHVPPSGVVERGG
jgi:hypothetical protein